MRQWVAVLAVVWFLCSQDVQSWPYKLLTDPIADTRCPGGHDWRENATYAPMSTPLTGFTGYANASAAGVDLTTGQLLAGSPLIHAGTDVYPAGHSRRRLHIGADFETLAAAQAGALPPPTQGIASIAVAGQPVKVWDHTQSPSFFNGIDGATKAWKEADGTVNLLVAALQAHRLRGPDFDHLTFDTNQIRSNIGGTPPNDLEIPESGHGFWDFIDGPYSVDGVAFYSLTHSEWYAALATTPPDLVFDANILRFTVSTPADNPKTRGVLFNSWTTTVNMLKSIDGGASWARNAAGVGGNFTVADTSYHWTGTVPFTSRAYLHAVLYSGLQGISRIVKDGSHYYAVGSYYNRDFSQINPATGQWQVPLNQNGMVLIRTTDFTNPDGWEAWGGGSTWAPVADGTFQPFLPMLNGVPISPTADEANSGFQFPGPGGVPDLLYDTVAKQYILTFVYNQTGAVHYMTSPSLAVPAWSDHVMIAGTAALVSGRFGGNNYPSLIDHSSPGFSFEFTSGKPFLYYTTGLNIWRVPLQTTYARADLPGGEQRRESFRESPY